MRCLLVHWFANHMPWVVEQQNALAKRDKSAARRYIATLFDAHPKYGHTWDGMERWVETRGTVVLGARTEMIGIP